MAVLKSAPRSAPQVKRWPLPFGREAVWSIAVFAALVSMYLTSTHQPRNYLKFQIKSSVSSKAQIFYDIGRGLNEEDSQVLPIAAGETFQTLRFPLPEQPIRLLRFDPLIDAGRVVIGSVALLKGDSAAEESIPLETVRPTNEILSMNLTREGLAVETGPQAHDPQTIFQVSYPIVLGHRSFISVAALGFVLFIATALGSGVIVAVLSLPTGERYVARACSPPQPMRFQYLCAALLLFMLLIFMRAPALLTRPRFWAEEGTVWFQHAITHTPVASLLFVFPESGYYIFSTNLAALLASITKNVAGLEYAPAATTYFSALIQLVPFLIILGFKSHLFNSWWKSALGCLILLCAPTATGEVWLNSINSPSYVGAAALVLLFFDASGATRITIWALRITLLLIGLSGLYGVLLFPLYALSYVVYKERERIVQAVLLAACFLIQVSVVLLVHAGAGLEPTRFSYVTPDTALVNILFFEIINPITGEVTARHVFHYLGLSNALTISTSVPRTGTVMLAACFSLVAIASIFAALRGRRIASESGLLMGAFVIYAAVTSIASLGGIPNGRYAFLPGAIFLLLIMDNLARPRRQIVTAVCGFVLAVALFRGITMYRAQPVFVGPEWSNEVKTWRANPEYGLQVWPGWWASRIHCKP
jgi:hypothetical protein